VKLLILGIPVILLVILVAAMVVEPAVSPSAVSVDVPLQSLLPAPSATHGA